MHKHIDISLFEDFFLIHTSNIDGVEFTSNVFLKMLKEKCYSKSSHEVIGLHFHR